MSDVQLMSKNEEFEKLNARLKKLEAREKELIEKLYVHEVLHKRILDALPMTIFLEDEEGRTLFANKTACEYNNKTREQLTGMTVFDFFPPYVAKLQRAEDLEVWREKKLRVKETLVEFNGVKTNLYCGKTIVQFQDEAYLLGFGLDISGRVKTEQLLKESEQKFRKLVEQAGDCFILFDTNGVICDVNVATCNGLRYTRKELLYSPIREIMNIDKAEIENIDKNIEKQNSFKFEHKMLRKDKSVFPVETNFSVIYIADKKMYLAWSRDLSDRKKAELQIKHMAYHDALTGLPNRWFVHKYLEEYLEGNKVKNNSLGVFLLDLDHFKAVNDRLGHQAGDTLLQETSQRLKSLFPELNTLARLGGDEFLLLVPNLNKVEDVLEIGIGINEVMNIPFIIQGHELNVSTSIGISLYPHHGEDFTTLLKKADIALYQSKEAGRNGHKIYFDDGKC